MAALKCPKHGMKIAIITCEHAGLAINERRVVPVFLQRVKSIWVTLCEDCVKRPDLVESISDVANEIVCGACVVEWAEIAKNDFVRRSHAAQPEFPKS